MDVLYWVLHPLDTPIAMCLLLRSKNLLQWDERRLETAFLIAEELVDYPDLKITEKGEEALRWHFHDSPLISHLDTRRS